MYIWPVLVVWDTAAPDGYRKEFQSWWTNLSRDLERRYGIAIEMKLLQLRGNSPLLMEEIYNSSASFILDSNRRLDPVLRVSSVEFREFADHLRSLNSWFLMTSDVPPAMIKICGRSIDRSEEYCKIISESSRNVKNQLLFEYKIPTVSEDRAFWTTDKVAKRNGVDFEFNWAPIYNNNVDDSLSTFSSFLSAISTKLVSSLKGLGPRNSSNPGATPQVAPVSSTVVPVTTTEGPTRRAMDWNNKTTSQASDSPDVRPTREVKLSRSEPGDAPAAVNYVDPPLVQAQPTEPSDQTVQALRPTSEKTIAPNQAAPVTITLGAEQLLPDVEVSKGTGEEKDEMGFWKSWFHRPKGDVEELPKDLSVDSPLPSEDTSIEAELPIVLVAPQGDVVRRAKNGQLIVDTPSTINNREWWSPKWFKVPVVGPSRDLELEYGGVSTLRLMAASVRGTRHQFYGEPNQDAFAIGKNDKYVVIVVCDGVGSKAHSAYGSKYISFSVARSLAKSLETVVPGDLDVIRSCITTAVQKASDGVQTWSDGALFAPDLPSSEVPIHELSSTLMVGVIEIEASIPEGRMVVLANVGDSPCYTFVDESWTLRTAATKEGDVLEHKTDALPNEIGVPVILEWHDFVMNPREQLLLMTDGIGTSLASGQTPLGRWLGSRLSTPILAKDFLTAAQIEEWVDTTCFDRQGEDDDRTLVVLYDFDHAFSEKPLTPEPEIKSVEEVESSTTEMSDESKSELSVEETPQTEVSPPVAPPPTVEA